METGQENDVRDRPLFIRMREHQKKQTDVTEEIDRENEERSGRSGGNGIDWHRFFRRFISSPKPKRERERERERVFRRRQNRCKSIPQSPRRLCEKKMTDGPLKKRARRPEDCQRRVKRHKKRRCDRRYYDEDDD